MVFSSVFGENKPSRQPPVFIWASRLVPDSLTWGGPSICPPRLCLGAPGALRAELKEPPEWQVSQPGVAGRAQGPPLALERGHLFSVYAAEVAWVTCEGT